MKQGYYKYKIENLLHVSKIVTVHYFHFQKNFQGKSEKHDFWELVYAEKESVFCFAEEKKIVLKQGEILFHKPNERHSLSANGKTAPNVLIVSFECKSEAVRFFENKKLVLDKDLLRYIYAVIEESKKTFDLPYSDPELKKMPLKNKPALGGMQLIKNFLETILIGIMRSETEKTNSDSVFLAKEDFDGFLAGKIIEYLNEKIFETVKIDDLQQKLNYHKSYLFRQFKAATGSTIMQYFSRLKIEKAKTLLRESESSVTQISETLSFDTPNYFSKTFKKQTGYTPLQYRKIHRN